MPTDRQAWPGRQGKGEPTQHSASSPMGPRRVQVRRAQEAPQAVGLSPEPGATAGRCLSWPGASLGIQGPPLLFPARLLKPDMYVLKEGACQGICACVH